ncbi:uncharacterized protein [Rutidosis leptorrhynchoides]|uniref:uncharacterized protein n=1 Tax=Rutidosis leptorrhynchoides TaxID=125765 RepID=UPI003A9A0A8F
MGLAKASEGQNKQQYSRLFKLESNKNVSVNMRVLWSNNGCDIKWDWLRRLRGRTIDEETELKNMILNYSKSAIQTDTWRWILAGSGQFTTKELTKLIDEDLFFRENSLIHDETLRNHLAPLKVEVFIWRLIRGRLPVRLELNKRAIDLHSVLCPLCDDYPESIDHVFFFCKSSYDLWDRVYKWWGFGVCLNLNTNDAFRGKSSSGLSIAEEQVWQVVEWTTAYFIWNNRNRKVFSNQDGVCANTLMEIQLKAYEWVTGRLRNKKIDWLCWLTDPKASIIDT